MTRKWVRNSVFERNEAKLTCFILKVVKTGYFEPPENGFFDPFRGQKFRFWVQKLTNLLGVKNRISNHRLGLNTTFLALFGNVFGPKNDAFLPFWWPKRHV